MQKILIALFAIFAFLSSGVAASAATWKPVTPEGYAPITWAKATGIASFFKAPSGSGSLDFLTRIYLPQNQIQFIFSTTSESLDWGLANTTFVTNIGIEYSTPAVVAPTTTDDPFGNAQTSTPVVVPITPVVNPYHNFAFPRFVAEQGKRISADNKFVWNAPFFNVTLPTSDLSMGMKYTVGTTTIVSSGSRPDFDIASSRRMLLINNRTGRANIQEFDAEIFVGAASGDQAFESFAPDVGKSDGVGTARLFIGVMPNKQELVIYCSQSATVGEASRALSLAGVPLENQLQADGGGSASCGYNLPGQYFVEPNRTLPVMMGASTLLGRGNPTTDGLNVRSGPATKYSVVTKINKNITVRILEEKTGWYRIGDGQWVSKTLIKKQ
ncbi:MAG: SH3 domain-containing protein [Candidatus Magasanikbacteria bacterium]|nr:SH3 domain-containing protein [Candidatus Magasanikbacteria bacterium]